MSWFLLLFTIVSVFVSCYLLFSSAVSCQICCLSVLNFRSVGFSW